jgi:hypothetical protein
MADPNYRVQVWAASGSTFTVGSLIGEFAAPKNIGYAKYLNDVGEAFFTVYQDEPLAETLRTYEGTGHVYILRNNEVVWRGLLSEHEASGEDVVFYAYGYEGVFFWLQSDWNQTWKDAQINTIVTALFNRAKTDLTYSQAGFFTSGTIEAPVTTSGGGTAIVLPLYKVYYKRILFALRELTAISTSDTTNICYFECAYTNSPTSKAVTFNFWKNKTTDQAVVWQYGVNIKDFQEAYVPILSRNDILGVGSGARNQLYRVRDTETAGTNGYQTIGRRQEPVYLSWVRDETDLTRVIALRAARALRSDTNVSLYMSNGGALPLGATGSGYALGDRVRVRIDRGATQIDKLMLVMGQQVIASRGRELVIPMVQEKGGT